MFVPTMQMVDSSKIFTFFFLILQNNFHILNFWVSSLHNVFIYYFQNRTYCILKIFKNLYKIKLQKPSKQKFTEFSEQLLGYVYFARQSVFYQLFESD